VRSLRHTHTHTHTLTLHRHMYAYKYSEPMGKAGEGWREGSTLELWTPPAGKNLLSSTWQKVSLWRLKVKRGHFRPSHPAVCWHSSRKIDPGLQGFNFEESLEVSYFISTLNNKWWWDEHQAVLLITSVVCHWEHLNTFNWKLFMYAPKVMFTETISTEKHGAEIPGEDFNSHPVGWLSSKLVV